MIKPSAARALAAVWLAPALLSSTGCSPATGVTRRSTVFDSAVVLTLRDHAIDSNFEACFARLRRIDAELNMWDPASGLARLNARAGSGPVRVDRDIAETAARGLELARLSEGIFDPTVGPLVRLWGIGTSSPRMPSEAEEAAARERVGWRRAKAESAASTVELGKGQALDFGALAKGCGAVEGAKVLEARGVRSGVLDVGGCVAAIGSGPGGKPWRIGVQDPLSPRGTPLGYFSVRESGVDTSGTYERYFEAGGKRYAHIFDTRTGRPVEGSAISATVVLPLGQNPDGPPLILLVLGPEKGIAFADSLGMAAVILDSGKRLFLSKAAKPIFTLLDSSYSIAGE